jgi:beta-galactosidase
MWNDTVYQPGEITAIAYRDGQEVDRTTVRTAGAPHHVVLEAYRGEIPADGESLNYVTATVVDRDGVPCPLADQRLTFCAEGAADVYATDAGDQRETECFLRPDKRALSGKLVCCLRAKETSGSVKVTCSGEGLLPATLTFDCV